MTDPGPCRRTLPRFPFAPPLHYRFSLCLLLLPVILLSSPLASLATWQTEADQSPRVAEVEQKLARFKQWLSSKGVELGTGPGQVPLEVVINTSPNPLETGQSRPQLRLVASRDLVYGENILVLGGNLMVNSSQLESPYKQDPSSSKGTGGEGDGGEGDGGARPVGHKHQSTEDPLEAFLEPTSSGGGGVGEEDFLSEQFSDSDSGWVDVTTLAAWLLRERAMGNASAWAPYIALLPEHIPLPLFFQDSSLQLFEDEQFQDRAQAWKLLMEREFERCRPAALAHASLADFMWAMSMVISRSVPGVAASPTVPGSSQRGHEHQQQKDEEELEGSEIDEEDAFTGPALLLPLADLADHSNFRTWTRTWKAPGVGEMAGGGAGSIVFQAYRAVRQGEELVSSYGRHSNSYLLQVYGFMLDHNWDDGVAMAESVDDVMGWYEEYVLRDSLEAVDEDAVSLVHRAQQAVEALWEQLAVKYKAFRDRARRRQRSAGGQVDDQEAMWRAEQFSSRAQFLPTGSGDADGGRLLAAWHGGAVDPRLLAALAALSFFHQELKHRRPIMKSDLDFQFLANVSITYGWGWRRQSCESLGRVMGEDYVRALGAAGGVLQEKLRAMLKAYTTKLEKDVKCLAGVETCEVENSEEAGQTPGEEKAKKAKRCLGVLLVRKGVPRNEVIAALKHRIAKKKLLQSALEHLSTTCGTLST